MSSTTEIRKIIEDFVYGDFDEIEPSDYLTKEEIKEQNESIKNYLAKQKENLEQINSLEKDKQKFGKL